MIATQRLGDILICLVSPIASFSHMLAYTHDTIRQWYNILLWSCLRVLQCCLPIAWAGCMSSLDQPTGVHVGLPRIHEPLHMSKPAPNVEQLLLPFLNKNVIPKYSCLFLRDLWDGKGHGAAHGLRIIRLARSLLPAQTRAAFRKREAGSKSQLMACS